MIKEAIAHLIDVGERLSDKVENVDGRKYWSYSHNAINPPTVSPVACVKSLDAMLSALDAPELAGLTEDCLAAVQIVVIDQRNVSIVSAPDNTWAQREHYIDAEWRGDVFPFDKYLQLEEFIVKVQSRFCSSDNKAALIAHVSSIVGTEEVTAEDDGISQAVVVEDRLGRKNRESFNPIICLSPYRTFPEVPQPESRFLLRMKKDPNLGVMAALFEADGGLWVAEAVMNIAEHCRKHPLVFEKGVKVIG